MAKNTDNHNWNVPEEGDDDYEATFSTFFDQIDRDVEIKDTDTNKSNYTPKSNAKFLATDTENVYLGDGSSWNKIASSGKNPTVERLDSTLLTHATDISENYTLDSGEGAVVAGPLTGSGSISGNGRLAVIQEGHQFTDNVDAQGNNLNNVGSLNTDDLNITKEINYWPPVRIAENDEANPSTPPTTYQTVTLSAPPSDASHALLRIALEGDGTNNRMRARLREGGSSRVDLKKTGWAGHGAFTVEDSATSIPLNSNNEIEYRTENVSSVIISTVGYF